VDYNYKHGVKMIAYILLSYVFMFVFAVWITCADVNAVKGATKLFIFAPITTPFICWGILVTFISWVLGD